MQLSDEAVNGDSGGRVGKARAEELILLQVDAICLKGLRVQMLTAFTICKVFGDLFI
jgi:hypothetical protein